MSDSTLVFVYGTLKRGQNRHAALAKQQFVCAAHTAPCYRMHDCGGYPGLLEVEQDGVSIAGEIYRVDAKCLALLDEIEEVPRGLYRRARVKLEPPREFWNVQTYLYRRDVSNLADAGTCW
jgi:gamma-glutamylaminecyclotransferase